MDIISVLLGEHAVLYRLFGQLEKLAPKAATIGELKIYGAILASALAPHADLEDELLFNELESALGADTAVLDEMSADHRRVRGFIGQLMATADLAEARALLLEAMATAREHFHREEATGFPLATERLSAETLRKPIEEWASRCGVAWG